MKTVERSISRKSLTVAGCLILMARPVLTAAMTPSLSPHLAPLAQQNEPMNFTLEGKISKVEGEKFIVSTEQNIIFHVRYNDKTEIKHEDGTAASAKDLRVGTKVRVEGDLTESGEIIAQKIQIQQEGQPKTQ